jgi:hypothetical protein
MLTDDIVLQARADLDILVVHEDVDGHSDNEGSCECEAKDYRIGGWIRQEGLRLSLAAQMQNAQTKERILQRDLDEK